jgi:uncharacterized coiled-coil protein SlyX
MRRKIVIGISVLAVAAFAGGAFAATQQGPVNARQAFLSDVAQRLHVSTDQLKSAISGAVIDELNTAVAKHKLTQAQAGVIKRRLTRNGALPLAGLLGGFPGFGGFGGGLRGAGPGRPPTLPAPGPPFQRSVHPRFLPKGMLFPRGAGGHLGLLGATGAAVKYLGIAPGKLLSELSSGKTLTQIAAANGKTTAGLQHAIAATRQAFLNRLVAAKVITKASAAKRLARFEQRLSKLMTARHPLAALLGPPMLFGFRGPHWSHP